MSGATARVRALLQPARSGLSRQVSRLLAALDAPPGGLKAGPRPAGTAHGPVLLVLLLGAEPGAVAATAARLAEVAAAGRVRPLLVLDRPELATVRRAGLAVEHVVDERTWRQRGEQPPWPQYLATRLDQLHRDYATGLSLVLPPGGTPAVPEPVLAAALEPPPVPAGAALRFRLARLVERWFDPPEAG